MWGKHLGCQDVETNGEALINAIKATPGRLHLCLEECTQSAWLAEILSPKMTAPASTASLRESGPHRREWEPTLKIKDTTLGEQDDCALTSHPIAGT